MQRVVSRRIVLGVTLAAVALAARPISAYSVFTHEELIDLAWRDSIRPLLLVRFPGTTDAQLREAHAYAYGGCTMQDMGYYPFENAFFTDLTHYVRSGDFVNNLLREARTVDEYAFAIGALSHFLGDSIGHSEAINRSTGIDFPKLAKKYGAVVTYEVDPHAHIRTEFGFDIGQLTKRIFAPPAYMKFIGFQTPRELLERAFRVTYGFDIHGLFGTTRVALHSYRSAVRSFIPAFAGAEIVLHGKQFPADGDTPEYETFIRQLKQADYERHWAYTYRKPGIRLHLLAIFVKIIPKFGPAALLAIKIPNAQTEALYIESVNHTVETYRRLLGELRDNPAATLDLSNRDLDTGAKVRPGAYALTDKTYAKLVKTLTADKTITLPRGLREDIVAYYADPNARITTRRHAREWKRLMSELETLKQMKVASDAKVAGQQLTSRRRQGDGNYSSSETG